MISRLRVFHRQHRRETSLIRHALKPLGPRQHDARGYFLVIQEPPHIRPANMCVISRNHALKMTARGFLVSHIMQRRAKQPVADWPIDGFSRAFRQTVEFLRARELSAMLFPQSVKAK